MRSRLVLLLLLLATGCLAEPSRVVHGTIVGRTLQLGPPGYPEIVKIFVADPSGDCRLGAQIYVSRTTQVERSSGTRFVAMPMDSLTVGRVVKARVSLSGETSCPIGTHALYIRIER